MNYNAALAKCVHEGIVLVLCTLDPKHIIEEEALAVLRCKAADAKAWPVNKHFA
ncbi:hypothetical protein X744_29635 [Mesorhizobium sp. LNJC372A00]|nr:hypothetical protein X745_30765 [Mesorhizobium sp. LNJC374B00]ESY52272.1 hypothetical protein X744_29635 [Mesorhizobium sp. LNJC372A00]